MKRRILSMLLVVCMVISMLATAAFAAPAYVDIENHWGEEAIEYWSAKGVVGGVGDGRFNPDGLLTRAEAAAILARLLKLSEEADISKYTDCVAGEWYYASVAKCVAAGVMNGTSATTMEPGAYVTRAQMFTMYCRALGIEGQAYTSRTFVDSAQVPVWAATYVNALLNLGYISGTSAVTLEPLTVMNRASVMQLLYNSIAAYITDGGNKTVEGTGIVLVVTDKKVELAGNFTGTVVATQKGANISLKGCGHGAVKVIATNDGITVTNAPCLTVVCSANGAASVTVNGKSVPVNGSYTVPCTCGSGGAIIHSHNYSGAVTKPATCTENGVKTYSCTCGHFYTEVIPATGHTDANKDYTCDVCGADLCTNHTEEVIPGKAATCVEPGLTDGKKCSVCGDILVPQEVIPATGLHVDDNYDGNCDVCEEPADWKFKASITAGETASAVVYDNYFASLVIPAGKLDPENLSIAIGMKNVAGLGVSDERNYSLSTTIESLAGTDPVLKDWLGAAWNFNKGATVNATVDGNAVTYTVEVANEAENGDLTITAEPSSESAASTAFHALTDRVATDSNPSNDSYILVKNGSYISLGGETLAFESDEDVKLDGTSMAPIMSAVTKNLKVYNGGETDKIVIYAAAGSTFALGTSVATLTENAKITISAAGMDEAGLDGILSAIRANASQPLVLAEKMVTILNQVVAVANGNTITVDVEFTSAPVVVEPVVKFEASITAGETASVKVYDDYTADIVLPAGKLTPSDIKLAVSMTDVASLGITGTRSYELSTTVESLAAYDGKVSIPSYLDYIWNDFSKTTANVTINGASAVTYKLEVESRDGDMVLAATPDQEARARAAFAQLAGCLNTAANPSNDSVILVKAGSSVQIGKEVLEFENGAADLVLDGTNLSNLKNEATSKLKLTTVNNNAIKVVAKAGSVLALGGSKAVLAKDVTIELSIAGVELTDEILEAVGLNDVLSTIRMSGGDVSTMIQAMLEVLDAVASMANKQTINVVISF